jgi:hypothetical protein
MLGEKNVSFFAIVTLSTATAESNVLLVEQDTEIRVVQALDHVSDLSDCQPEVTRRKEKEQLARQQKPQRAFGNTSAAPPSAPPNRLLIMMSRTLFLRFNR